MTQKAEITFEVEETIVLKQGGKIASDFCPRCGQTVDMVSPDVLALATSSSEREIFRLIESGEAFFSEIGRVLACSGCVHRCLSRDVMAERTDLFPAGFITGDNAPEYRSVSGILSEGEKTDEKES
jgi:hypothetical protein